MAGAKKQITVGNGTIAALTVCLTLTKSRDHKYCGIYLISNSEYCDTAYFRLGSTLANQQIHLFVSGVGQGSANTSFQIAW
jgi:hypothetical protein